MKDRKANKRRLNANGFVHVAGWVREEDAADTLSKIEAARDDVECILNKEGNQMAKDSVSSGRAALERLVEYSNSANAHKTSEELEEMFRAQQASFVRGEKAFGSDADEAACRKEYRAAMRNKEESR